LSDASGGDVSSYYGGSSSGVRLSSLVAAESRLRRKPQSTGGSAQSSPRAPVGIAETEFRRRGSVPTDRDEIEAEVSRLDSSGGLRTLGSARDPSLNYRDSAAMSAPGAIPTGNPFASSGSSAAVGTAGTSAAAGAGLGGSAAKAGGSAVAAASKAGTGMSAGGAAPAGAAAGAAGAAAVSGKPGFLGSLFGKFFWGVLGMNGFCDKFVKVANTAALHCNKLTVSPTCMMCCVHGGFCLINTVLRSVHDRERHSIDSHPASFFRVVQMQQQQSPF
jgi:hypothetical protein